MARSLPLLMLVWTAQTLAVLIVGLVGRRTLGRTRLNRSVVLVSALCVAIPILVQLGMSWHGIGPERSLALLPAVWSAVLFSTAITLDRRHALAGTGYLLAFLVAAWRHEWTYFAIAAGNLTVALSFVLPHRRGRSPRAGEVEKT